MRTRTWDIGWVGLAPLALAVAGLATGCSSTEQSGLGDVGTPGAAGTGSTATGVGGFTSPTGRGGAGGSGSAICGTGFAGSVGPAGSTGSAGRGALPFPPSLGATVQQTTAPPAVSGGTLRVLADGITAVASDPDRDRVYLVDLPTRSLQATIALQAGDEPGRAIEDGAGRVHVALRRGGAIVTIDVRSGILTDRRAVCAEPRGLAYDPAGDLLHVACRGGELSSLPAAGGDPVRTLNLDADLRDVVVDGPRLRVSRFRSAELLTVEADGTISERVAPPSFRSNAARTGDPFTASVAWQTMAAPDGTVVMLHQRGDTAPINPVVGGYGGMNPCDTILHPAVTAFAPDGAIASGPALAGLVLAVDMAISPDGSKVAFVSMGNASNRQAGVTVPQLTRVFAMAMATAVDPTVGCNPDGVHGPCPAPGSSFGGRGGGVAGSSGTAGRGGSIDGGAAGTSGGTAGRGGSIDGGAAGTGGVTGTGGVDGTGGVMGTGGVDGTGTGGVTATDGGAGPGAVPPVPPPPTGCVTPDPSVPTVVGEPIAIAYAGDGSLVVQSREPAMLAFADGTSVVLATDSRADTGHQVFHANSGGFIACASCHPEGNEDGRVWSFDCAGDRRTQSLQTGLRGTEPFHWSGDETNFGTLMTDVFVRRMSGPTLASDQADALLSWLDAQPRPPRSTPADPGAVERGRLLFTDTQSIGCVTCHAGSHLTNNATVDVGTGGLFQVPSLVGVGSRAPYMHNGCAATLQDRFSPACGGINHGLTSQLGASQISDLIVYLQTL